MRKIPTASQFTPLKEIWFIFRDGDLEIAAHNSLLAKESIFVNGEIVSESRSLNRVGKHQFVFGENKYEVVFDVLKIVKGEMECSLFKNSICIGKFKTYCSRISSKISYLEKCIICFLIMVFASSVAILLQTHLFFPLMAGLGLYILIIGKLSKGGELIIEEVDL
jgi:hypothetical protein